MPIAAVSSPALKFLDDRWDPTIAGTLDEPELFRYRSNLLGSDLRITNFAGGNTSSKITKSSAYRQSERALQKGAAAIWDIKLAARHLYQEKLLALEQLYQVKTRKTTWWRCMRSAHFGIIQLQLLIPLSMVLPFPMWIIFSRLGIALAAFRTGKQKWTVQSSFIISCLVAVATPRQAGDGRAVRTKRRSFSAKGLLMRHNASAICAHSDRRSVDSLRITVYQKGIPDSVERL
jgi:hypothetical protein